nr:PREDICTED: IgGFc-binding protein-like [Paralichthys olivaceus]XP_019968163.1 PREDICTED: IgGFc-binding protein-like [Paralichthys olivaceus]
MHTVQIRAVNLNAGQTTEILIDDRLELRKKNISSTTLIITSSRKITVQATSLKLNSVQTALVIPTNKLGKEYLIPPVPQIPGTTDQVSLDVTERRPFTLFIVSAQQGTKVTIEGVSTREVRLQPQQVVQVLVQEADQLRAVKADQPVAVLFGHACAIRHNCTCGLLQITLSPTKDQRLRFLIPPFLAESEALLLISSKEATTIKDFDPDSPLVETSGTAILYRPGLLLALIPETNFASCYVISRIQGMQNFAVIVVHTNFIDGVRIGNLPLENSAWQQLGRTEFASTEVRLQLDKNVIWHTSHKMAVYFYGKYGTALFGNPAPTISRTADFRGCLLDPEVVHIGEVAAGWRESVKYCRDNGLQLVSLSDAHNVTHIYKEMIQVNNGSVQEAWIGMRRSSQTGEWYWLNNDPVNATNWEEGEPGAVNDGQCAIVSLESGQEFGWSDEDCCKAVRPVCYRRPVLFPLG